MSNVSKLQKLTGQMADLQKQIEAAKAKVMAERERRILDAAERSGVLDLDMSVTDLRHIFAEAAAAVRPSNHGDDAVNERPEPDHE